MHKVTFWTSVFRLALWRVCVSPPKVLCALLPLGPLLMLLQPHWLPCASNPPLWQAEFYDGPQGSQAPHPPAPRRCTCFGVWRWWNSLPLLGCRMAQGAVPDLWLTELWVKWGLFEATKSVVIPYMVTETNTHAKLPPLWAFSLMERVPPPIKFSLQMSTGLAPSLYPGLCSNVPSQRSLPSHTI